MARDLFPGICARPREANIRSSGESEELEVEWHRRVL